MPARGRLAFSLSVDPSGHAVEMRAELLLGAQLNRNDRLVFSRASRVETDTHSYKGSLKAILDNRLSSKYLKSLQHTTARSDIPGVVAVSIAAGKLEIRFSTTKRDRETWIKAKSGNRYIVVPFWLGLDGPTFGLGIPPGPAAFFNASLIFEEPSQPR